MSPVDEVDRQLAGWSARLARVDENLLALEEDATYRLLAGDTDRLVGQTRSRVLPALEAMRELFAQRALLNDVLAQVRALRAAISPLTFFRTDEALQRITALLAGPSIELGPVATPLAQRSLLEGAEQRTRVSPEQLLQAMTQAFDAARDVVVAAGAAWARLQAGLDAARAEAGELRRLAARAGESVEDELAAIAAELARLEDALPRDPLGAAAALDGGVARRQGELRDRLAAIAGQRDAAEAALGVAQAALRALRDEQAAASAAVAGARAQIAEAAGTAAPPDAALVEALGPWLQKLSATVAAGRWSAAGVGLARWRAAADGYLAQARAARSAAEALLARRDELRGRLAARGAQAAALAARGMPLPAAAAQAGREAERLLAGPAAPLGKAAALALELEAAVVALARRGPAEHV